MLKSLNIKNYAIIDELNIDFNSGFNVFTGETGAGKSIIVGALTFLIRGKADPSIIKTGKDKAIIEGIFEIEDYMKESLSEADIDFEDDFKSIMYKFYEKGQRHLAHRAYDFKSGLVKKYNGIENLKKLYNENEKVREEILETITRYANDPAHLKDKGTVIKEEKSTSKIIRPIIKVTADEVREIRKEKSSKPTYIKLPDTYERDVKMEDLYKFGKIKFKGGNINREMQSVYEKMRKKYGIVVEQLKKDYKNKYGIDPRSTIDAVKADDEAWSVFYPMLKDELEFVG